MDEFDQVKLLRIILYVVLIWIFLGAPIWRYFSRKRDQELDSTTRDVEPNIGSFDSRAPAGATNLTTSQQKKLSQLRDAFDNGILTKPEYETKVAALRPKPAFSISRQGPSANQSAAAQQAHSLKNQVQTSKWMLDAEANEISKDILVYRDQELSQRIQIRYVGASMDALNPLSGKDPLLVKLLSKQMSEHITFVVSPPIGAGDGYLVLQMSKMDDDKTSPMIVRTSDSSDHSVLQISKRHDASKLADMFASESDIVCNLIDMDEKLVRRFVVPNEEGFAKLRATMS